MNPYLVLGVPLDADDARIRRAYLDAVKACPPETHPEQFKEVAAAYEKIEDELARHRYELFDKESPGDTPLEVFLRHSRRTAQATPLNFDAMKEFLRACSKT
jgi:curved DNA-binding protein CbpA